MGRCYMEKKRGMPCIKHLFNLNIDAIRKEKVATFLFKAYILFRTAYYTLNFYIYGKIRKSI